jgi:hypothetical protein
MKELYIFGQSVRLPVFTQIEPKVSQARDIKDRVGVVKNMNPFLPFAAMATDFKTGKSMVATRSILAFPTTDLISFACSQVLFSI